MAAVGEQEPVRHFSSSKSIELREPTEEHVAKESGSPAGCAGGAAVSGGPVRSGSGNGAWAGGNGTQAPEEGGQGQAGETDKKAGEVPTHHKQKPVFLKGMYIALTSAYVNILLLAIPPALASPAFGNQLVQFFVCLVAIIPLASLLGHATEELALYTSQTLGGILNATFGNAVELILGIIALEKGLLRVVQASIMGSILSNLLLVLGMAFVAAGLKQKTSKFNSTASQTSSSLLLLAIMGLVIPAALSSFGLAGVAETLTEEEYLAHEELAVLELSRFSSIVLILVYIAYLVFQLKTHSFLYADEEEEEAEDPSLPMWGALLLLSLITALVAIIAESMVSSIEAVVEQLGISEVFVGLIILPIVGNAAEHTTAVTCAYKNKMNLSIGVAVGSSLQICLLCMPVLVLIGWIIDEPLTMNFEGFETACGLMTVIIVNAVIQDGESTYLEGIMLIATYLILAAAFFYGG